MLKITTIITALLLSFPGYLLSAKNVNIARAVYGTKALIEYQNKQTEAASAIDGSYDDNSSVTFPGVPAKLILNFPSQYKVYKVRIYPGMLIYANYPSSECGIKSYRIEGLINGGWKLLAKNNNVPDYKKSGHQGNENHFFEHKFEPIKIEALRLVVLESGFTGKTSTSKGKVVVAAEKRHSFIREIEAFETDSKISKIKLLDNKIDSDFRLPVYRDQKQANLVIINKEKKPLDLNLSITGEKNPDKIILERKLKLNSGRNEFKFDISQLKNGRYLTILEPHKNSSLKGRVIRLLRIDRLPEAVLPKEPIDVSNLKVFPFDNYYIAKRSGVKNKLAQAEIHQAAGLLAPNRIQQRAWNMNFDKKNNLVIKFFDATRSGKDRKWHYAWSRDFKNWTIGDKTPTGKEVYNPRAPEFPAEVQPDWKVTAKNNENVFRFYDSKRDEKPEVNQIYVKYSSVKKVNWGKVDIPYRSTFAVWQKKNGEVVILDKEPFLIDKVSFKKDEFEKENYTNDNFAPQYLGNKGEVLYYPRGAMVRRFKPFTAEYDNLAQGFRLLKIFYTRDGLNWKQTFFTLPTEKDPWGYQHYGANIIRIPRADLFIAYLYVYDVAKQQIYLEINYSRDGLRWERMSDQPPFVSNGKLGEWNSGMVFLDGRHIERDGVYYHVMGHTTSACHFYVPCYRDNTAGMSPEALERRFKSRELEKWPYFKQIGGWQGLSEKMFAAHASTGVLTFRKDSWIGVNADNSGRLVSRILKAADCKLIVNALIRDGGSVKVEVLSEDNTEIPMYSGENAAILTEDNTAAELKWNHGKLERLPEGSFRLRISLEKAALYTLDFINSKRLITSQDFEDKATFNSSLKGSVKQSGNPDIHWRNFQPETVEVTKEENSNNQAVLLTRVDGAEGLSLRGFEVGKDKNYCLTFSAKRYPKSNFGVSFDCFSPKKNVFSLYITPDGKVNVKSGKQRPHYLPTSIVLKADKWYKISVDFDSGSRSYFIKAVDDENIEQKSKRKISLPVVEKINMISFRPAPGVGNKTLIDNIKLNEK